MKVDNYTSYLIGLFQSDGHLHKGKGNKGRATIEISEKDKDIIHKIKEIIPYNYSIKERSRNIILKNKNYLHKSIYISVSDIEFRKFLNENGVPYGKKSEIINVPENISKNDYIRGLFDGDGSLGFTNKNIPFVSFVTESEYIKEFLLDFYSEITNKTKKKNNRNKRDNLYNIILYKEDAVKFCEIVYYNDCLSLDRKYNKSKEIRKWIRPDNMKKIKIVEKKYWTKEEDDYVLCYTTEESILHLKRTKESIVKRKLILRKKLGLTKKLKKWSVQEDEFVSKHTLEESIKELDRSKKSIYIRKYRLENNLLKF